MDWPYQVGSVLPVNDAVEPSCERRPWPDDLLVVIPVFNHARTVGDVAAEIMACGAQVLVVDDGSTDGSGDAARAAGADVICLAANHGKACALRRGMDEAHQRGFGRVLSCDADGQHPLAAVLALISAASTAPDTLFIGCRDMRGAPLISRFGRICSNCSSWLACGRWVGDSQSGLRIYPIPATNHLAVTADRYCFEIEVLIRAAWRGIPIDRIQVPVLYPRDRISHFHKLHDNLRAARLFARLLGLRLTRRHRPPSL